MAEAIRFSSWPTGGTALFPSVSATGFGPVTAEILEEITRRIVAALQPKRIILFGSYANGRPTPDSDVDLLVILETTQKPAERQVAVSRLIRPRPFPVDILTRTPQEIEESLRKQDPFIQEILAQGKVLYG